MKKLLLLFCLQLAAEASAASCKGELSIQEQTASRLDWEYSLDTNVVFSGEILLHSEHSSFTLLANESPTCDSKSCSYKEAICAVSSVLKNVDTSYIKGRFRVDSEHFFEAARDFLKSFVDCKQSYKAYYKQWHKLWESGFARSHIDFHISEVFPRNIKMSEPDGVSQCYPSLRKLRGWNELDIYPVVVINRGK